MDNDFKAINKRIMLDTKQCYETDPDLIAAVQHSIQNQKMIAEEDTVHVPSMNGTTKYVVSGKRSFEAAKDYIGKKTAVLSFANNHDIGGAPFSAGAQEESLCRCSTLFPCLQAMDVPFYKKHQYQFNAKIINALGNDDLIYTPDVVVFKKDERTKIIEPKIMPREDWYKVNIITCAAPILKYIPRPINYEQIITRRIKRILDVATAEQNEVLILGAWGCGDYKNPIDVVAKVFVTLLQNYHFDTVEFALSSGDGKGSAFDREIQALQINKDVSPIVTFAPASPDHINTLKANQIFVFGSNLQGKHGAGAAKLARDHFGAIWGQGVGLQGQSYAIPTMQGPVNTIKPYVDEFLAFAANHPEMEFLVTRIGCGIAGFNDANIAPLFAEAIHLSNVRLPQSFIDLL